MVCITNSNGKVLSYTCNNLYHLPSVRITNNPAEMVLGIDMELLYILFLIHLSFLVTTEISYIVGSMTHVYIITVYATDWKQGRSMSTSDQVIISIMISRMILQSVMQLNQFMEMFCIMCSPTLDLVMRITYFSSMYSSFWLSTLLSVVFYLKISNIRSVFFLHVQRIISKRILHFIMASLLVSIGQTSVTYLVFFAGGTHVVSLNFTYAIPPVQTMSVMFFVNMSGPLLIFLLSSLFLITSLYLHIRHMKGNRNLTSSLDPYYRTIMYMTGSIFTSVLCVIISVLGEIYYYLFGFISFSFPWTFFGTLHSMLLIYATPKLKNPLSRILKSLSNCWMKREEPGDLVMTVTT